MGWENIASRTNPHRITRSVIDKSTVVYDIGDYDCCIISMSGDDYYAFTEKGTSETFPYHCHKSLCIEMDREVSSRVEDFYNYIYMLANKAGFDESALTPSQSDECFKLINQVANLILSHGINEHLFNIAESVLYDSYDDPRYHDLPLKVIHNDLLSLFPVFTDNIYTSIETELSELTKLLVGDGYSQDIYQLYYDDSPDDGVVLRRYRDRAYDYILDAVVKELISSYDFEKMIVYHNKEDAINAFIPTDVRIDHIDISSQCMFITIEIGDLWRLL